MLFMQKMILPEDKQHYLVLNEKLAKKWPEITEMKAAPIDADDYKDLENKEALLCESLGVDTLDDV